VFFSSSLATATVFRLFVRFFSDFSFSDWFTPVQSEVDLLKLELLTERRLRKAAEERMDLAGKEKRLAERERDLYKVYFLMFMYYVSSVFFLVIVDRSVISAFFLFCRQL
jgi:uncharacterized membrane protein YjjP (DUF1212 family)